MQIRNNIMAMNTHRFYTANNNSVSKSAEKLSSGYRINRAGDDAAGLAISEKMRAQIRGLNMAKKNSQDAVSLVQTAEGALQEVHSMLQRMNEMAVQAASDTNDDNVDRAALQQEFLNLQKEIDQVAETTKFNDIALLGGAEGVGVSLPATDASVVDTGVSPANAGKVTFAVGDDGTVKASVDGTEKGNATVSLDLTQDGATPVAEGSVTVKFDNVTTTLNVGTGTTVDDVKKAIAGLSYTTASTDKYEAGAAVANLAGTGLESLNAAGLTADFINGLNPNAAGDVTVKIQDGVLSVSGQGINKTYTAELSGTGSGTAGVFAANDVITATFKDETGATLATATYKVQAGDSDIVGKTLADTAASTAAMGKFDSTTDGTATTAKVTSWDVTGTASTAAADGSKIWTIQVGAEQGHTLDIKIGAISTKGLKLDILGEGGANIVSIDNQANAEKAITATRSAINAVSTQRAELGAMQNRLEYKINNLATTAENTSAAESRIRDVDLASEMTNFTKNNILSQAATAMLAQANSLPQNVLSLLR